MFNINEKFTNQICGRLAKKNQSIYNYKFTKFEAGITGLACIWNLFWWMWYSVIVFNKPENFRLIINNVVSVGKIDIQGNGASVIILLRHL